MKSLYVAASALMVLAACAPSTPDNTSLSSSSASSSASSLQSSMSASSDMSSLIQVDSPAQQATVSSPLVVQGSARGTWYFEATFPVRLLDADGSVLVESFAEAQGDWMTQDFVPFQASLTFTEPSTQTGMLVLEKSNPSGLPENAANVVIPVQF